MHIELGFEFMSDDGKCAYRENDKAMRVEDKVGRIVRKLINNNNNPNGGCVGF